MTFAAETLYDKVFYVEVNGVMYELNFVPGPFGPGETGKVYFKEITPFSGGSNALECDYMFDGDIFAKICELDFIYRNNALEEIIFPVNPIILEQK
jgi:hypothetical protein